MKVILLCKRDWANFAYILASSLRKVGVDAKTFFLYPHKFNYAQRGILFSEASVKEVEDSDVVIFVHSEYVETGVSLEGKIVAVCHTGTKYRQGSREVNRRFNPVVDVSFCGGDVLGMGAKNEVWIQPPIDTEVIRPIYKTKFKKVIVGHYPSGQKGAKVIIDVIEKIKAKNLEFRYSNVTVPWKDNLKRMAECDVYIEEMNTSQKGIPLYIFGMQALEAAALGKIVCTRFPMFNDYERVFGDCSLIPTNTPEILQSTLENLLSMSDKNFVELQMKTRRWVEERHSLEVIGSWLKEQFEKIGRSKHDLSKMYL